MPTFHSSQGAHAKQNILTTHKVLALDVYLTHKVLVLYVYQHVPGTHGLTRISSLRLLIAFMESKSSTRMTFPSTVIVSKLHLIFPSSISFASAFITTQGFKWPIFHVLSRLTSFRPLLSLNLKITNELRPCWGTICRLKDPPCPSKEYLNLFLKACASRSPRMINLSFVRR